MGYSTSFKGELKFKKELTASQLAFLKTFLGADRREIGFADDCDAYVSKDEYWDHIDLELLDDFSGLKWNGAEKTYGLEYIINFITKHMRNKYNDFDLIGSLSAQGEEAEDRYVIDMEEGIAIKKELNVKCKEITCPNCEEKIKKVLCSQCEEEILLEEGTL